MYIYFLDDHTFTHTHALTHTHTVRMWLLRLKAAQHDLLHEGPSLCSFSAWEIMLIVMATRFSITAPQHPSRPLFISRAHPLQNEPIRGRGAVSSHTRAHARSERRHATDDSFINGEPRRSSARTPPHSFWETTLLPFLLWNPRELHQSMPKLRCVASEVGLRLCVCVFWFLCV